MPRLIDEVVTQYDERTLRERAAAVVDSRLAARQVYDTVGFSRGADYSEVASAPRQTKGSRPCCGVSSAVLGVGNPDAERYGRAERELKAWLRSTQAPRSRRLMAFAAMFVALVLAVVVKMT